MKHLAGELILLSSSSALWSDSQDFYLQIDTHSTFVRDWDVLMIEEWRKAKNPSVPGFQSRRRVRHLCLFVFKMLCIRLCMVSPRKNYQNAHVCVRLTNEITEYAA